MKDKEVNFMQLGQIVACGHCKPDLFSPVEPCGCKCHQAQPEERLPCGHTDEEHMEYGCGNPNQAQPVSEWEEGFRQVFRMPIAYGDVTDGIGNVVMKHQVVEREYVRNFIKDLLTQERAKRREEIENKPILLPNNKLYEAGVNDTKRRLKEKVEALRRKSSKVFGNEELIDGYNGALSDVIELL